MSNSASTTALTKLTEHPFWHFSVEAWKQKAVEEKCLFLQKNIN